MFDLHDSFRRVLLGSVLLAGASTVCAADSFPEGTQLYGYADGSGVGLYSLTASDATLLWSDTGYQSRWFTPMTSAWLDGDRMCGYANDGISAYYVVYDLATGAILQSTDVYNNLCFSIATLNPDDSTIYGFTSRRDGVKFVKAPKDSPTAFEEVAVVDASEMCVGMTYNTAGGFLAGMRKDGTLVKIDADGTQTVIFSSSLDLNTGVTASALAYNSIDGMYYWNPTGKNWDYLLYAIDVESGTAERFSAFPDRQFKFLISAGRKSEASAPVAPEILSAEFVEGSADGKFIVRMPSVYESGQTIAGDVEWSASVDGVATTQGTAAAGSDVTVPFEGIATGSRTFSFTASVDGVAGEAASQTIYVGFDTPKAPENVVLGETSVSWDAVTEGVNGGYVNTAALSYTVSINGEEAGVTTDLSLPLEGIADSPFNSYRATVTASSMELTSAPAESDVLRAGQPLSLPLFMAPNASDIDLCETTDGDGDGRTWTYDAEMGAFKGSYNMDVNVDDWLILPPVEFKEGGIYYFSMEAARRYLSYPSEALEVRAGRFPTPEAMAQGETVVDFTLLESDFTEYNGTIHASEGGKWYIGIHAMSAPDQVGLYVREISVSDNGVTASSPAAVMSLWAEGAADASLKAKVSFIMPRKTAGGSDIDPDATLEATVTAQSEGKVSGKPGERVSVEVATLQGMNRIMVEPSLAGRPGLRSYVDVYTGYDVPGSVTGLGSAISQDMMSAEISWTAPSEGASAGVIDPEALTYNIYQLVESDLGESWDLLAGDVKGTSYVFATDVLRQDVYTIGVAASNVAGTNPEPASLVVVLGTPHSLPMHETFDNPPVYYTYNHWVTYMPTADYATQWGILPAEVLPFLGSKEWNVTLCGMGLSAGALGRCGFPVFSTKGYEAVVLKAPFWTGDMATPDVRVTGITYGMDEPVEIGAVVSNGDWNEMTFALPAELLDKEWVNLFLEASFPEGSSQWVCMDSYSITPASGVSSAVGGTVSVSGADGRVIIVSAEASPYAVYAVDGRMLASGEVLDRTVLELPAGVYIVTVGSDSFRVAVR